MITLKDVNRRTYKTLTDMSIYEIYLVNRRREKYKYLERKKLNKKRT
jgi:hypothetical protein